MKILTVEDLQQKTQTIEDREILSKLIRINQRTIYIWAKQADLMRVAEIDATDSQILVESGVRHVGDLAAANTTVLMQLFESSTISYKRSVSADILETWKREASELRNALETDPDDLPLDLLFKKPPRKELSREERDSIHHIFSQAEEQRAEELMDAMNNNHLRPKATGGVFYFGLGEMIAEMGRGVAQAQHELDMSALAVQKYIDADESLSNYGLTATWYVLPETSFTVKVDYAVVKEETQEGELQNDGTPAKSFLNTMRIAPINAKYQNYFKSTASIESELKFKIIPIPPPTRVSDRIPVPDLLGLSVEEAKEFIKASLLRVGVSEPVEGTPENGKDTQVVMQSKDAGTEAKVNDIISIAYYRTADYEEE